MKSATKRKHADLKHEVLGINFDLPLAARCDDCGKPFANRNEMFVFSASPYRRCRSCWLRMMS